jgi:predicted small lipoprotein YifL
MTTRWKSVLLFLCGLVAGCNSAGPPEHPPGAAHSETSLGAEQQTQQQVALAARDAMAGRLGGRLMEAIGSSGPASAIGVCQEQAPQIAAEIGEQFGVDIGRTSFRLRNPKNAPPEWARTLVDARQAEPQFVALPDGRLGALLPIRLKAECLLCHGPREQVLPEIRETLAARYPQDQATDFDVDELRGWFWVSVPAGARLPTAAAAPSVEETAGSEGGES